MFWRKLIRVSTLQFFRETVGIAPKATLGGIISITGPKQPGYGGNVIALAPGTRLQTSLGFGGGKDQRTQTFSAMNSAITVGIKAAAQTVLAATTLVASVTTLVSTGFTQPDVPRSLRFAGNQAGLGDGSFVAATGKWVLVRGTNQFGDTIVEAVALNGTNVVESIQAFQTITSVLFPPLSTAGDTVAITTGLRLGIENPVQSAGDIIEIARKATGATAYTIETLPTVDVGEAYARSITPLLPLTAAQFAASGGVYFDSVSVVTASIVGAYPAAPFLVEITDNTGAVGLATCTAIATSGANTVLTIARGVHGSTLLRTHLVGSWVNWRSAQVIVPTVTANDRLKLTYRSGVE